MRVAGSTTINAIVAGVVPSANGKCNGGMRNLPHFLEKWSGKSFTNAAR